MGTMCSFVSVESSIIEDLLKTCSIARFKSIRQQELQFGRDRDLKTKQKAWNPPWQWFLLKTTPIVKLLQRLLSRCFKRLHQSRLSLKWSNQQRHLPPLPLGNERSSH